MESPGGELGNETSWMQLWACQEFNPELFFPKPGKSTAPAKKICEQCVVREACLDYALFYR